MKTIVLIIMILGAVIISTAQKPKTGKTLQQKKFNTEVKTDSAESSPASFFEFVCPEILNVSISRNQCTDKGHDGHHVAKISYKGIDHGFFILATLTHIPAACTSVS